MSNLEIIKAFLEEHHIQHAYGNIDISNNFELFEIIIYHKGLTISFIDLPDNTVHMKVTGEEYATMNLTIDKAISYLRKLFCPGEKGEVDNGNCMICGKQLNHGRLFICKECELNGERLEPRNPCCDCKESGMSTTCRCVDRIKYECKLEKFKRNNQMLT